MASETDSPRVLIVGCGRIGTPLGQALAADGFAVCGLTRTSTLPAPLQTLHADVTQADSLNILGDYRFDYVVISLTPGGFSDDHYRRVFIEGLGNVLAALRQAAVKRVLFVSSTSVYHQSDGRWVDEDSPVQPTGFSGQRLLEAEQMLIRSDYAYSVVRFAGIYGPGRRRLIDQVRAGVGCARQPALYTNRIHSSDCVGFLQFLINRHQQGKALENCYIGVDSTPVSMWEIKRWLAAELAMDPEQLAPPAEGEASRRNSKRCSNRRLLASGYRLRYPDYRDGYRALLAEL